MQLVSLDFANRTLRDHAILILFVQILDSLDSIIMGLKAAEVLRKSSHKKIKQVLKESMYLRAVMPFDCESSESDNLVVELDVEEGREVTGTVQSENGDLESQRMGSSDLNKPENIPDTPVSRMTNSRTGMSGEILTKADRDDRYSLSKQSSPNAEAWPTKRLKDLHQCVKRIREANIRVGPKSAFMTFVKAYWNLFIDSIEPYLYLDVCFLFDSILFYLLHGF